jgi:hypothetical protein
MNNKAMRNPSCGMRVARGMQGGGNGCGCNGHGGINEGAKKQMINKLQKIDFSIVDTLLYLDAYPTCTKAKARYDQLLRERADILEKLFEMGIPLTNMSVSAEGWNWTDGPWPWEYAANV